MVEEDELQRLGGRRSTAHGIQRWPSCICFVAAAGAGRVANSVSSVHAQTQEELAGARTQLVSGYAEHRASLSDKKQYRRAIKIDLKLPEASTALAVVPRRKDFAERERRAGKLGRRSSTRTRATSRTPTSGRRQ